MSKHTPGPWIFNGGEVVDSYDNTIALVNAMNQWNTTEGIVEEKMPWEANARLIAAAPKMLEFIHKVAHWELVECDIHEYVMEDEEVRIEAHRILNDLYNE